MNGTARTLTLPWPPSVNTYWRRGPKCTYLSKRGREFREEATEAIYDQLPEFFGTMIGPVSVHIELYPPTRRDFDVDNYAKGVLDVLQSVGLLENDSQVHELMLSKKLSEGKPGRCEVYVWEH